MTDLGVVDPLRLPEPVARLFREVPRLAWAFFALAIIDAASPVLFNPGIDPASYGLLILSGLSRGLLIALPAVALVRRATVRIDAPRFFWALVLVSVGALHNLISPIVDRLALATADATTFAQTEPSLISAVGGLVMAAGWLVLAWAFMPMVVSRASTRVTALAGIAIATILGSVIVALFTTVQMVGAFTNGDVAIGLVGFVTYLGSGLAWAALAWKFIRTISTDRSPAAVSAALWSVFIALGAGLAIASAGWQQYQPFYSGIWIGVFVLTPAFLFGAVALGLGDRTAVTPRSDPAP